MKLLAGVLVVFLSMVWQSQAFVCGGILARSASATRARASSTHSNLRMADVVVEFTRTGKTVNAVVGTPLSTFCAKNGIKVKYSCKQGDCATCSINIDGRNVKACQGKVPASRRIIKIKA